MTPSDNRPDSLLIYSDWLIDQDREAEANKVRESLKSVSNNWTYECTDSGSGIGGVVGSVVGVGGVVGSVVGVGVGGGVGSRVGSGVVGSGVGGGVGV